MIGTKVAQLRKARGWNQRELAVRAQMHQGSISLIEKGRRRHLYGETLRRLAAALEVSTDVLLAPEPATQPTEEAAITTAA